MKRKDMIKDKAKQDFEDSLKEKCVRCGRWDVLNQYELCDKCEDREDVEVGDDFAFA